MDGVQPQPGDEPGQTTSRHDPMPGDAFAPDAGLDAKRDVQPDVLLDVPPDDAPDQAAPEDVPEPPESGDDAVDQATAQLARAMQDPLEVQLAAYEFAHRTLQDRLADVEN